MHNIASFIKLEIESVKPDIAGKSFILFIALAVVGYIAVGVHGLMMGIFPLATNATTYAFSAGNNGLDKLYITLAIKRKTVVVGRYLFSLLVSLVSSLAYFAIGSALACLLSHDTSVYGLGFMAIMLFFIISTINAIDMPILFKLGYKRAKMISLMLPMLIILGLFLVSQINGVEADEQFLTEMTDYFGYRLFRGDISFTDVFSMLLTLSAWGLVIFISYLLSLFFYRKREF